MRAVAVLFIRIRLADEERLNQPLLEGGRGSLAASLDAALAKPPQWLLDMFGVDANGASLLRRIVQRTNAELKRPGPVSIYLQSAHFNRDNIRLSIEGRVIEDTATMHNLLLQLEDPKDLAAATMPPVVKSNSEASTQAALHQFSFGTASQVEVNKVLSNGVGESASENSPRAKFLQQLNSLALAEARRSLSHTDIFSIRALCALNQRISSQNAKKNGGYAWTGTAEMDFGLSSAQLLGLVVSPDDFRRVFDRVGKFTLCLTPSHIGAIAIFTYLQRAYGLQLDLRCQFPHTSAILAGIQGQSASIDADGVILAHSQSQSLLGKSNSNFRPLMFMPATSYSVVAAQRWDSIPEKKKVRGDYLIFGGRESTSYLVFNDLLTSSGLSKKNVRLNPAELHEITHMMSGGDSDSRAVLWYPYYGLCGSKLSNGKDSNGSSQYVDFREVVLFLNQRIFAQSDVVRTLNLAIRDAWIRLMSDPSVLAATLANCHNLTGYEETIYRCSGAWRYSGVATAAL